MRTLGVAVRTVVRAESLEEAAERSPVTPRRKNKRIGGRNLLILSGGRSLESFTVQKIRHSIFFYIVFAINHAVRVTFILRSIGPCIRHISPFLGSQGSYLGKRNLKFSF